MAKVEVNPPTPNLIIGITCLFSFLVEAILSQKFLGNFYLFDWTSKNGYWFVWVGIIFSTAKRKPVLSMAIACGNLVGLILGHFLGDFDLWVRLTLYGPNPPNGPSPLSYRYEWKFWLNLVLLFTIMGAALQHKYTVDGYPTWMQRINARMKRRIGKIWDVVTRLFPG